MCDPKNNVAHKLILIGWRSVSCKVYYAGAVPAVIGRVLSPKEIEEGVRRARDKLVAEGGRLADNLWGEIVN